VHPVSRRSGFVKKILGGAKGAVLWEGPSLLDGKPIVVIATSLAPKSKSANTKTGDAVQCWIMRADTSPATAVASGEDRSVCGDCKFRPHPGVRRCYVHLGLAGNIYGAYKEGYYPPFPDSQSVGAALFAGRVVRLGAYGDPAFVPVEVWRPIFQHAAGWLSYTHTWQGNEHLKWFTMASVDTEFEREDAKKSGWRTYRVLQPWEERVAGEIICPGSREGDKKIQCERCRLCDGTRHNDKRKDIANPFHGPAARKYSTMFLKLKERR
jgi:hypothetical protein